MFSPARGRRASSDAATICEVNGGLQTAAAYADVVAHGLVGSDRSIGTHEEHAAAGGRADAEQERVE